MAVTCTICSETLESSACSCTKCGHVYHHDCLLQWLRRSKKCPICRKHINFKQLCKVYLNFTIIDDLSSLQKKVNELNLQLQLQKTAAEYYEEANKELQNQEKYIRELEENEILLRTSLDCAKKDIVKQNQRLGQLLKLWKVYKAEQILYKDLTVHCVLCLISNCFIDFMVSVSSL